MNRGIYPILSGALAQEHRLQVIANNLANANTTAYKRDETLFASLLSAAGTVAPRNPLSAAFSFPLTGPGLSGGSRFFVTLRGVVTGFQPGRLRTTGNTLDVAIQGQGFFEVKTPYGVRYTRNGMLHVSPKHELVTDEGYLVMGKKGPLKLGPGDVRIAPDGTVTVDGQLSGVLKIVEFPLDRPPEKVGDGLYRGTGARPAKSPLLAIGHIEESNVNAIGEMVQVIEVMRSYESAQRLVQTFDRMTEAAIQDIGRVV